MPDPPHGASPLQQVARPLCAEPPAILRTSAGHALYVEAPQTLQTTEGLFLVGWPSFKVDSTGGSQEAFVGAFLPTVGAPYGILRPPNTFALGTPRPVITPEKRLNLLWWPVDSTGESSRADSLVWSEWNGDRWSTPLRVPRSPSRMEWGQLYVTAFATVGGRPFLITTPGGPLTRGSTTVSWTPTGWKGRPLFGHYQMYSTVAVLDDTTMVVSYVDAAKPDGNTVFVRQSFDGGATWSKGTRVGPPASGAAYEPQILALSPGRLAVVWASGGTNVQDRIWLATSDDRGASWSVHDPFQAPRGIVSQRSVVAGGNLYVALQQETPTGFRPALARWTEGRWNHRWLSDDSLAIGVATAATIGGDSILVAWGEVARGWRSPVTRLARIKADCQP